MRARAVIEDPHSNACTRARNPVEVTAEFTAAIRSDMHRPNRTSGGETMTNFGMKRSTLCTAGLRKTLIESGPKHACEKGSRQTGLQTVSGPGIPLNLPHTSCRQFPECSPHIRIVVRRWALGFSHSVPGNRLSGWLYGLLPLSAGGYRSR